jgi:hypothetical protein
MFTWDGHLRNGHAKNSIAGVALAIGDGFVLLIKESAKQSSSVLLSLSLLTRSMARLCYARLSFRATKSF